ncbi:carboxypeptidase-like regulatory domain-containing protein [Nannocystis sp. ILAH1]|uniref:carboxypeptidase-like regulatory domain-containing protein n=1 Tax=unclassified Nannocystis TaxID=2627009 RepID=UPI00226DCAC6|nr:MULTISPECIES: carboxypeptidase-like regulatory domain-containing protein [unclassified Nannocystis]MCY0992114.1 carboxypeptidase-like regulatory domain-containing protein [Nannocystis sp. ILAH1]MCY1064362.1 carboxypeptidase-like regulatory domain-containing protein [Nannocystis sp. RBIL2]
MDRRSLVAVVLGVVSVACATGVLERGPNHPPAVVELLSPGDSSQLVGVVHDRNTGHAIPAALVIIQCTCLAGAREMMSNDGGAFGFRDLPPGKYTVQVLFGYANVNRTVELAPATRMRTDFRIDPDQRFTITVTHVFDLAPGIRVRPDLGVSAAPSDAFT